MLFREPIGLKGPSAGTQRFDFGMRRRIVAGDRTIGSHGEDGIPLHQHRAHGHFARRFGARAASSAWRMKSMSLRNGIRPDKP